MALYHGGVIGKGMSMKKIKLLIICFIFSLVACSTTTEILRGDEVIFTVNSKADAMVSYKRGDGEFVIEEFVVDNRGAPSTLDKIFDVLLLRTAVKGND